MVWNYTSLDIDWSFTAVYGEICVVGWSLGVFAAAVTTPRPGAADIGAYRRERHAVARRRAAAA